MKGKNYNILFTVIMLSLLLLIVTPAIFKFVNRIEPWIFGLPFVMFWIVFLCLCMSITLIAWYVVDKKSGALNIDIELASEEEMASWKCEGEK